jgi:hypothetical protein
VTDIDSRYRAVAACIDEVRRRWRTRRRLDAATRGALTAAAVVAPTLWAARWLPPSPLALGLLGVAGALFVLVVLARSLHAANRQPSDRLAARFIEEQTPGLDERLVSAVHLSERADAQPTLAGALFADAARAAASVDPAVIISGESIRRAGFQAAAALALLAGTGAAFHDTLRASFDAWRLVLFPARVALQVTPGSARIEAGTTFTVHAQLVDSTAPVTADLVRATGTDDRWERVAMEADGAGRYTLALTDVGTSFRYKVVAGPVASTIFDVAVVRPPHVTRIDVEYTYPPSIGLRPRVEEDSGDIYAPAGTAVRLTVHTDVPAASGHLAFGDGGALPLSTGAGGVLQASLQVGRDGSYRVALSDAAGLASRGDTEYFIRTLDDRPPEVHVTRPASDRRVTPLEEVDVEADAEDDFGVAALDLVYTAGGVERVVPLPIPSGATSVKGRQTLYLEEMGVRPGEFVSYYVRARDLARGKPSSESRSDIFFLEVRPFSEEFTLAQSQASMGGGQANQPLDDLVAAQKQIVVATWKLDRRSRDARGARSDADIRSLARAEEELKTRVEQQASALRQSAMRDPRSRATGRGGSSATLRAGQALDEEDAMTRAAIAMGQAVVALRALTTANAIPPELEALTQLLKAQADLHKRQIVQQASGTGSGNRSTQDLSSLFDKELARHQQTNYETPQQASTKPDDRASSALDAIRDLTRRQDELLREQQTLARDRARMRSEQAARELERLTREQNELRRQAEELARTMEQEEGHASKARQEGQAGQAGQAGRAGRAGNAGRMKAVSEEMRNAESGLRRQDAGQASASGTRARDQLRELERQLDASTPDSRRRTLGDLQLEARQLADDERRIGSEAAKAERGEAGRDARRRLAGEQDRLGDRLRRVEDTLRRQAASSAQGGGSADARRLQQAAGDAAHEIGRRQLADRMQQVAAGLRGEARTPAPGRGSAEDAASTPAGIARALDRLADMLAGARSSDVPSQAAADQLARARELRDRLEDLSREMERLNEQHHDSAGRGRASAAGAATGEAGRGSQPGDHAGGRPSDSADEERARMNIAREMAELRTQLGEMASSDGRSSATRGGVTFEGPGMTLSAPGTEGFKQDFARWQDLRRQATAALDRAETALTRQLQAAQAKDRLAAAPDESAPRAYAEQVERYFRALAAGTQP